MKPLSPTLPLVLIGGTLCNEQLWQPLIAQLGSDKVHCVNAQGADSASLLSQRLLDVLPQRFCLVGFSLGAIVALQMLADAPQRIAGLALLSVNPLSDAPENAAARRRAVEQARSEGVGNWLSRTLWPRYVAPQRLHDAALHHTIIQMAEACGVERFAQQTEIAISRNDHRRALAQFAAPVLILGGAHDPICTPQHHRAAAEAAACERWVTLPECGHFLPLEDPRGVATLLRHWLQEILP